MVKMIFLAPNTEALEALDDKIDVLLSEAHSRNIPICYCLNKRKLVRVVHLPPPLIHNLNLQFLITFLYSWMCREKLLN